LTVNAIVAALEAAGHRATFLEGDLSLVEKLPKLRPDICFNISEGHWGDSRESHVPAILEMLRIPYTGSGVLTLALTLDKAMAKRVLAFHGLPTPAFQVFERADEPLDSDLRFPLFVKPSREGTGGSAGSPLCTASPRCGPN
jgi:D-alanine-D-alanine ligase